jgi:hypothetical protein
VDQSLISKLKGHFWVNPRVIAFILTEPEWKSLYTWDAECIKVKVKHGAKAPKLISSHHVAGGLDLKDWSALLVNRWKNAHFWLAGRSFPKLPKFFRDIDIEDSDYLIFIRLTRMIDRGCHLCKVQDICPNLLGYLTHEFIHIVEYEQNTKMLPEKFEDYYGYVALLLKEIFSDELSVVEKLEAVNGAHKQFSLKV